MEKMMGKRSGKTTGEDDPVFDFSDLYSGVNEGNAEEKEKEKEKEKETEEEDFDELMMDMEEEEEEMRRKRIEKKVSV